MNKVPQELQEFLTHMGIPELSEEEYARLLDRAKSSHSDVLDHIQTIKYQTGFDDEAFHELMEKKIHNALSSQELVALERRRIAFNTPEGGYSNFLVRLDILMEMAIEENDDPDQLPVLALARSRLGSEGDSIVKKLPSWTHGVSSHQCGGDQGMEKVARAILGANTGITHG